MKAFLKNYLTAVGCVLACMVVYRVLIVPFVEPSPRAQSSLPRFDDSFAIDSWWAHLFPADAWQVSRDDKPTIIQNGRGVLLAKTWEQVGPKTWRLQPLTMILPASSSRDDRGNEPTDGAPSNMWIVNAEAGAIIHFEQPFDLKSGRVPSVEQGQLSGEITIERRSIDAANDRPWSIRTSEVSIDRRRISTQQSVLIEWGDSRIRGRDLRVMLSSEVLGKNVDDDESNPWGPLDELELYRLDELDVALSNGGLWGGVDADMFPKGTPDLKQLPARIYAACGGRFMFNFKSSEATLTNGVHVRHQLSGMPADEFLSHKLTIKIDPAKNKDPLGQSKGGMQIRELLALGVDSVQDFVGEKWVELKSPTMDAAARGKRLRLEFDQQRIELAGKLEQPGATQSIAWLTYQGHQIHAPLLQYQAAVADAKLTNVSHAGWLLINGPGELATAATKTMGSTRIRWDQSLQMRPSDVPDEHWLELSGKAMIENDTHGYLAADRIEAWLRRNPNQTTSSTEKHAAYLPDRLLATKNPVISSGSWTANVESLLLKMIFVPTEVEPKGVQLNDSAGNPMYQFVTPPDNQAASSSEQLPAPDVVLPSSIGTLAAQPLNSPSVSQQNVVIRGNDLNAAVVMRGSETWVDALTIDGPVVIRPDARSVTDSQAIAWKIEGDQLKLATNTRGQANLQIDGAPARIDMADGYILGPSISLDQENNRIWMDHAGTMMMPLAAMQNPANGNAMQWSVAPTCTWGGKMQFDGSVIRLLDNIKLDGVLRRPEDLLAMEGFCDQLDVILANPVDLRDLESKSDPAAVAVERVIMRNNVDLRLAQTDLHGNRQSLQRMFLPILTFHAAENRVVGGGEGWINAKFLSTETPLNRERNAGVTTPALQGAHLSFRDSMVGYLDRREVIFDGKVELVSGPLGGWQEAIDPAKLMQLQRDQMLLNCDQLKAYDTTGLSSTAKFDGVSGTQKSMFNFQAIGNVNFEGQAESGRYRGNGARLIFEQAKEQLILTGDGRTPARLDKAPQAKAIANSQPEPRDQGTHTAYVNSATINVKTLEISDLQLSQYHYQAAEPGQPVNTLATPNVPATPPPNPRIGVSNFLQPNK